MHQSQWEDPLNDPVQGELRQKTHLIQLYTSDPDEGPRLISDFHPNGVPIMIIITPPSCCYYKLNIPHGIVSLEQNWGKFTGMMQPGYYCCYCSNKRIAAMITKNVIQFSTLIEACPTKDNVKVHVDISINFHIGREETREADCRKFLYYLGANRLEELLNQELEESIRNFVRTHKVVRIRDIKQELTAQMMCELNQRFNNYGVYIDQTNVSNVIIPKDLRIALSQATTYDVLLQNQVRFQENVKLKLMNGENMAVQSLKRENQKKILELQNQLAIEEIQLEKQKVLQETVQQIAIINAKEKQSVKVIQADTEKDLAQKRAMKIAEEIVAKANSYSEAKVTTTNASKQNMISTAQTRFNVAQQKLQGKLLEAQAEQDQANNLQAKRKFQQRLKQAENFKIMTEKGKILIGGSNSDDLLDFFRETGDLVNANEQLQRKNSTSSQGEMSNKIRSDIKSSLEQQKQSNKEKFEDPFFIKIGDTSKDPAPMKIVKQKKKNAEGTEEESLERKLQDKNSSQQVSRIQTLSQSRRPTISQKPVIEAREEEEVSPKLRLGQMRDLSKKVPPPQARISHVFSEDGEYERVSMESPSVKTLPLVKLDVNMDTLKNYLEDIQEAVNDHAKSIGVMQVEMKKKANEQTVGHYFLRVSEGLHKECGERPHAFRLEKEQQNFLSDHYQTEDSTILKKNAERLQEKLEVIGLNIINMNKFKNQTDDRLEKIERMLPKCFTIDQFREESQSQELRTMTYVNEKLGNFQENLNKIKTELTDAITFFEKKVNDNQSATLWRIKDCEELLRSRVSDKYVNDAVKAVEDKLTKISQFQEEKQLERLEKTFKELGSRIITTNNFFNEKFEDLRKVVTTYDSRIQTMATNEKLASVQTGYRDMKYNFEREMESLQDHLKETKDKIGELMKRFSNLEQATNQLASGGDFNYNMPGQANMQNVGNNQGTSRNQNASGSDRIKSQTSIGAGPKKQSPDQKEQIQFQLHSPMSPLKKRQKTRQDMAMTVEIEKKVQMFQEMVENLEIKLETLKKQLDNKITAEDVRKLTSDKISKEDLDNLIPSEEITQEKMKYLVRDEVDTLWNKINEQFKQYENKIIRLRAEVDIHSIQRQLERKANEDQVRNDFSNHEFKIGTLDRNIIRMAGDFETFQIAIHKMHSAVMELQDSNRDVLLGKRTNNCLSCGKGGDGLQTIVGKDGRTYKAAEQNKNRLFNDDTNIVPANNYSFEGPTPILPATSTHHNLSQNQSNIDLQHLQAQPTADFYKIRPSQSFYDNGVNYESQNLPSLHSKKFSAVSQGLKNIPSTSVINNQSQNAGNSSFQMGKRKLPFGFQVQNEKKELYKVSTQQRGKSSHNMRPQTNRQLDLGRPDSAKNVYQTNAVNFNNSSFDI